MQEVAQYSDVKMRQSNGFEYISLVIRCYTGMISHEHSGYEMLYWYLALSIKSFKYQIDCLISRYNKILIFLNISKFINEQHTFLTVMLLNWIKTKVTAHFKCLTLLMIIMRVKSHRSTLEILIIKNQVHFTQIFEKIMRMYLQ